MGLGHESVILKKGVKAVEVTIQSEPTPQVDAIRPDDNAGQRSVFFHLEESSSSDEEEEDFDGVVASDGQFEIDIDTTPPIAVTSMNEREQTPALSRRAARLACRTQKAGIVARTPQDGITPTASFKKKTVATLFLDLVHVFWMPQTSLLRFLGKVDARWCCVCVV